MTEADRRPGSAGFTLVEAVIALVVIAAGAAAILLVYVNTAARSADPMVRVQAQSIAGAYMDEIMLGKYCEDPDPPNPCSAETGGAEAGEARSTFDDVWDYDGIDEDPTDRTGTTIAGLDDYDVAVAVETDPSSPPASVTVTVTHASGLVDYRVQGEREDY